MHFGPRMGIIIQRRLLKSFGHVVSSKILPKMEACYAKMSKNMLNFFYISLYFQGKIWGYFRGMDHRKVKRSSI
ncbi:hypothetical protein MNBD_ALPHA03-1186 [hydrothermal vent metagenome]|uniref:Uncharacterized protein n=1 Tax=hydrothermal vent metagenome TaxID=652676 RepID=A0A3B1AMH2_9ZZZZ